MRMENALKLERIPYPGSTVAGAGENLRVLARDEAAFIPPVDPAINTYACPAGGGTSTSILLRRMKQARLTWVELDELAYDVVFHASDDERTLPASSGLACVPVSYARERALGTAEVALRVVDATARAGARRQGSMIVLLADESVAHHELEPYRSALVAQVAAVVGRAGLPLLSYVDRRDDARKARSLAVAHYTYWLYDHERRPVLTWHADV